VVNVLAIGLKARGFKSGQKRWILRVIKICSMTSFVGEVKPSFPSRKRTLPSMRNKSSAKLMAISRQVSLASLPGVRGGYAVVDESRIIRTPDREAQ
jgi:hypothetical protein